jgi:hypothetical protein
MTGIPPLISGSHLARPQQIPEITDRVVMQLQNYHEFFFLLHSFLPQIVVTFAYCVCFLSLLTRELANITTLVLSGHY